MSQERHARRVMDVGAIVDAVIVVMVGIYALAALLSWFYTN